MLPCFSIEGLIFSCCKFKLIDRLIYHELRNWKTVRTVIIFFWLSQMQFDSHFLSLIWNPCSLISLEAAFFPLFFFLPILHVQTLLGNSLAQVTQQSCFFSDGLSPSIQFYKSTSLIISEYLLELTMAKQSSSVSSRNCFTMQFWYSPTQFWPLSLIYLPPHKSCRILFFSYCI